MNASKLLKGFVLGSVFVFLALVAGFFVLHHIGWAEVAQSFAQLHLHVVLAGVGLALINAFLRGGRYVLVARALRLSVPAGRMYLYFIAGFALLLTPAKLGTAVRLWLIKRGHGVPVRQSAPLLVVDQLTDLLALLVLLVLGTAAFATPWASIGLVIVGITAVLTLFTRPELMRMVTRLGARVIGRKRLFAGLRRLTRNLKKGLRPSVFVACFLLSLTAWLCNVLALWWLLDNLNAPLAFSSVAFVYAASVLFGSATFVPGGVGTAEAAITTLLTLQGVPLPAAVAATLTIRLLTLWLAVAIGFIALPFAVWVTQKAR